GATPNTPFPVGESTWQISISSKRGATAEGMVREEVWLSCIVASFATCPRHIFRLCRLNWAGLRSYAVMPGWTGPGWVTSSGIVEWISAGEGMGWVHLTRHYEAVPLFAGETAL
ncbi:hypothetical protein ACJ73_09138, partial [Blastomyces percursus]